MFTGSFVIHLCSLLLGTAIAQPDQTALYRSPTMQGAGGAGLSDTTAEDALMLNPSRLCPNGKKSLDPDCHGWAEGPLGEKSGSSSVVVSPFVEVSRSTLQLVSKLQAPGAPVADIALASRERPQHVGLYNFTGYVSHGFGLGLFEQAETTGLLAKDKSSLGLEVVSLTATATRGATVGWASSAKAPGGTLTSGVSLKYLLRDQLDYSMSALDIASRKLQNEPFVPSKDDIVSGSAAAATLGFTYAGTEAGAKPHLSLVADNIGDTTFAGSGASPSQTSPSPSAPSPLKQTLTASLSFSPLYGAAPSLRLLSDYYDVTGRTEQDPIKRLHLGVTAPLSPVLTTAAGINQGYPSASVQLNLRALVLDGGFYTEELGGWAGRRGDQRLFIRVKLQF